MTNRERTATIVAAGLALLLWGPPAALAFHVNDAPLQMAPGGLLDSEPPNLPGGGPSRVVYRMGPVYYDPGHVDTIVTCTNLSAGAISIALELYDGTNVRAGVVIAEALGAGAAITFTTSDTPQLAGAVVVSGLRAIEHGKARVSATTARLACDAQTLIQSSDPGGSPKTTMLELVKKVAFDPD